MKTAILTLALLTLVSCGRARHHHIVPTEPQNASIINKFHSEAGLHGINDLDFSELTIGLEVDVTDKCNGTSFGNSGLVGGVSEGHFAIFGDDDSGVMQYGHLNYLNPRDNLCRDLSKESYNYNIVGEVLTLCMVNYPYCATYTVVK